MTLTIPPAGGGLLGGHGALRAMDLPAGTLQPGPEA